MKNRKNIYVILTVFFAVAFYIWDNYFVEDLIPSEENSEIINNKQNLLPTSTIGQIVHHNNYSLSYNEKFE